jgi:hypothetical protein
VQGNKAGFLNLAPNRNLNPRATLGLLPPKIQRNVRFSKTLSVVEPHHRCCNVVRVKERVKYLKFWKFYRRGKYYENEKLDVWPNEIGNSLL